MYPSTEVARSQNKDLIVTNRGEMKTRGFTLHGDVVGGILDVLKY